MLTVTGQRLQSVTRYADCFTWLRGNLYLVISTYIQVKVIDSEILMRTVLRDVQFYLFLCSLYQPLLFLLCS